MYGWFPCDWISLLGEKIQKGLGVNDGCSSAGCIIGCPHSYLNLPLCQRGLWIHVYILYVTCNMGQVTWLLKHSSVHHWEAPEVFGDPLKDACSGYIVRVLTDQGNLSETLTKLSPLWFVPLLAPAVLSWCSFRCQHLPCNQTLLSL